MNGETSTILDDLCLLGQLTEVLCIAVAVYLSIDCKLFVASVNTSGNLSYFLYSVVGSVVDSYLPDLVLQGVQDNNFRGSLSTDLKFTLQVQVI